MNRIVAVTPIVSRTCTRRIATSQVYRERSEIAEIRKKQMHFQMDNDVPIYLKNGSSDSALFYITVGMVLGGLGMSLQAIYKLATTK